MSREENSQKRGSHVSTGSVTASVINVYVAVTPACKKNCVDKNARVVYTCSLAVDTDTLATSDAGDNRGLYVSDNRGTVLSDDWGVLACDR